MRAGKLKSSGGAAWRRAGCVVVLAACGFVSTVAAAAEPPVLLGRFGPDGTPASSFAAAGAIAVDQTTGDAYVLDPGAQTLYRFGPEGEPLAWTGSAPYLSGNALTGLSVVSGNSESQVAVDQTTHTVYVTDRHAVVAFAASGERAEFTAGTGTGGNELGGFAELLGVAVDADGAIYVSDFGDELDGSHGSISVFAPSGAPVTGFQLPSPANIAVSPAGTLYVNRYRSSIVGLTPSSFPVEASTTYEVAPEPLDPREATSLSVDPGSGDLYAGFVVGSESVVGRFDGSGALRESFPAPGGDFELTASNGVAFDSDSAQVLVSDGGLVDRFGAFVPPVLAPEIVSTSAVQVTADSARLEASINPHTLTTRYRFEYGSEDCSAPAATCTSAPASDGTAGSGFVPVAVSQDVAGLVPGTVYHYRVVAENSLGSTAGPDRTFVTQGAFGQPVLADGREWELVSPAIKVGGGKIIPTVGSGPEQASAAGDAIGFNTLGPIEDGVEGNRAFDPSETLARHGASGWSSRDVTPPSATTSPVSAANQYRLFSEDLATAVVEPWSPAQLSGEASEKTPYLRQNFADPVRWRPLVTGKEGFANVPAGTRFGGPADAQLREFRGLVRIRGASADLRHVVVASQVALSSDAVGVLPEDSPRPDSEGGILYEWTDGTLALISVLPSSEGGQPTSGVVGSTGGQGEGVLATAVSEDGRFVYWSAGQRKALYVRDTATDTTVRLDDVQAGAPGGGVDLPIFQGASRDGRRAFFTDTRQLTSDAGESGADLYECSLVEQAGQTRCELQDLTPTVAGDAADVQGLVTGIDRDADRIFFVANGSLATGAAGGDCSHGKSPATEGCNLYVAHRIGSAWSVGFVARLSGADAPAWGLTDPTSPEFGATAMHRATALSPGGRYLAFMSSQPLTGYDNTDASSGFADEEVFVYDADHATLVCASCNPTGSRPTGKRERPTVEPPVEFSPTDGLRIWEGRWLAANLTDPNVPEDAAGAYYQPRSVLDDGRVFFNGFDPLVPADVGEGSDVYEYEPRGVGNCGSGSGSATTAVLAAGCVSLLSGGSSGGDAGFVDASASGDDAFFLTPARLAATDTDLAADVYDAHVCGSGWSCPPPAPQPATPCASAETCRPVSAPAAETGTPGSAGFAATTRARRHRPKERPHRTGKRRGARTKHRHAHRRGGSK